MLKNKIVVAVVAVAVKQKIRYGILNTLHITGGLAQAGHYLARKFVQIWKFIARPSGSGSPACAKPLGRCVQFADFVS